MYGRESLAGAGDAGLGAGPLRSLALAVLASLALHVLILYVLPILKESIRAPARPLTARLSKPAPEPPRVEPPPQRPHAAVTPRVRFPCESGAASAEPVAGPQRRTGKTGRQPVGVAGYATGAASQTTSRADSAAAPHATARRADPGSVARFRLELMSARRYKLSAHRAGQQLGRPRGTAHRVRRERLDFLAHGEGSRACGTRRRGAGLIAARRRADLPPALRGKAFVLNPVTSSEK